MANPYIMKKGVSSLYDLIDGYAALFAAANKVYFTDANHANASDSNEGDDPNKPMLTIAGGYGRLAEDVGDLLVIKGRANRYREDELTIEKDGIAILGAGWSTEWNRTSEQADDYVVKVQAKGVTIANLQISTNGAETGLYWGDGGADDANASMGLLENCFIRGYWYGATGSEGTIGITIDGSSFGPIIRNNYIWGWDTGIDVSDGSSRTAYGLHIHNNYITGKTYGIYWAGYGYTSVIENNTIWDWKSSVNMTYGISLNHSVGGVLVANNNIGCANPVYDSGDLNYWVGNKIRSVEAASEALAVSMSTTGDVVTGGS